MSGYGFGTDAYMAGRQQPMALGGAFGWADGVFPGMAFETQQEESEKPACAYCGLDDEAYLVQCQQCRKWFCNGRLGLTTCSHIVHHLIRSKHNLITLSEQSSLGDAAIECYNCSCRNIFLLGFIPAREDAVVALACREPCLQKSSLKGGNWDVSRWEPLIQDKALVSWLCPPPPAELESKLTYISATQMVGLERLWRDNPLATLADLDVRNPTLAPTPILLRYENASQYRERYQTLINLEAEYDRQLKESQAYSDVPVTWERLEGSRVVAKFSFPHTEADFRLIPGDELRLRVSDEIADMYNLPPRHRVAQGNVIRRTAEEEVAVLFHRCAIPETITQGFIVEFVWKSTSFERMKRALRLFAGGEKAVSAEISQTLLGMEHPDVTYRVDLPDNISAPNLPEPDHSQEHAIRTVLSRPLSLIQGPPGTGKTVTSATIVYNLVNIGRSPVLVCAPSNIAADQLAEKIHKTGIKVVRLAAMSREAVPSSVEFLCLHRLLQYLDESDHPRLFELRRQKEERGLLTEPQERELRTLRRKVERDMLKATDVIVCTCVCAGDPRLNGFKFNTVLIDESTQAAEPEVLIPIVKGCSQLVLVGDHCQLGPVIMYKPASRAGLVQSLFERLVLLGVRPVRLEVQYRMHPTLSEFPSKTFYEGTLQNGVTVADRQSPPGFPWPNPNLPMFFYASTGFEELSISGTSYINRTEAAIVERILTSLFKLGINPGRIGVITPYEGQRAFLTSLLLHQTPIRYDLIRELEIASVDSFQGREKDYIILSCVRSNIHQIIGFLQDPRRLNVALTRARLGLIIVGNHQSLSRNPLWNSLLHHFKEYGVLMEGANLESLQPLTAHIPAPHRYGLRRSFFGGALAAQITGVLGSDTVHSFSNSYPYIRTERRGDEADEDEDTTSPQKEETPIEPSSVPVADTHQADADVFSALLEEGFYPDNPFMLDVDVPVQVDE